MVCDFCDFNMLRRTKMSQRGLSYLNLSIDIALREFMKTAYDMCISYFL